MPRIASARLAAGALKSPIRLFQAVTVVPPVMEMPVTIEETPVEESPVTVLFKKFWLPDEDVIPVTLAAAVTLLTVLPETLFEANVLSLKPTVKMVTELVPATMLLNVLFVTVFREPGVVPSPLLQPVMVVAPVNVRFEKLLSVFVSVTVFPDELNEL